MTGFRILAIILGILSLALALGMFFHNQPFVSTAVSWLLQGEELRSFVKSADLRDMVVKQYVKYVINGGAVLALGLALMFFISAADPIRMRPFVVVLIVISIIWVAGAIWSSFNLPNVSPLWWGSDAAGALILAILLLVFFPKKKRKLIEAPEPEEPDAELEE